LEDAVRLLLEVSQPYPGDDADESDERRGRARFNVSRVSDSCYVIEDEYAGEISILPMAYLRVPAFSLAVWYAHIRANECGMEDFDYLKTYRVTIRELLADEVKRYLAEKREEYPVLESVSVSRVLNGPNESDEPGIFLVSLHTDDVEFVDFLSEAELTNPEFDLIGWILTRPDRVQSAENDILEGFADSLEPSYLGGLFNDEIAPEDELELFCGKAQIPADGYNGLRRTASMPKTPNRVVAKPLVVVAHVNNQPVRALIDSGSLGDLISTTVADQLHLRRSEIEEPIVLQLAVQYVTESWRLVRHKRFEGGQNDVTGVKLSINRAIRSTLRLYVSNQSL
jgi:hypothetical protein